MYFPPKAPRATQIRLDLDAIAAELRTRPGEWAVIEKGERGRLNAKAYLWRHGKTLVFAKGDFEFTIRQGKRRAKLYGRYVGEAASQEEKP